MIEGIELGILTFGIGDRESGRKFLKMLPRVYSPTRYNNFEPINLSFEPDRADEALDLWGSGFLWRGGRPRVLGRAWTNGRGMHDAVYLSVPLKWFSLDETIELLRQFEASFGFDLAYIHVQTSHDTSDLQHYKNHTMPFSQGLSTNHLRGGLPDMAWVMAFGTPYKKLFDARLETAPVHRSERLGDATLLQLTSDPADVDREREEYNSLRDAVRDHLNSDAFTGSSSTGRCNVPEFLLIQN